MKQDDYEQLVGLITHMRESIGHVATDLNMLDEFYPKTGKETVYSVKRLFDFCDKMEAMVQGVTVK
jgi:hypothetical protein